MTSSDVALPHLPPAASGTEYRTRIIKGEVYVTTGTFPVGAPDERLPSLHRAGTLVFDADVADAVAQSRGITHEEAKALVNAMPEAELKVHVDALVAEFDRAWETVFPDGPVQTCVIRSGGGLHTYAWLLDGQGYGDDIPLVRALNREVGARLNAAAGREMISLATTDAGTRILRPPGTLHRKNPERPIEVTLDGEVDPTQRIDLHALAGAFGVRPGRRPPSSNVRTAWRPAGTQQYLPEAARALLRPSDGTTPASTSGRFQQVFASRLPDLLAMAVDDPVFRHASEHPADVRREEWRALAVNLVVLAEGRREEARRVFHDVSRLDPERYEVGETDVFFDQAVDSARATGPVTYRHLVDVYGAEWEQAVFGGPCLDPASSPAGAHVARKGASRRAEAAGLPPTPPGTPPEAPPRPWGPWKRGDEVELGRDFAIRWGGEQEALAVYDREELRVYDDVSGAWRKVEVRRVEAAAQAYAGTWVERRGKDGEPSFQPLKLSHRGIQGLVEICRNRLFREGFFDAAPKGVCFRNGFVTLEGKLVLLAPEHRVLAENVLPFDYDVDAVHPERFQAFLESTFAGDADASEKIAVLQEFMGAAIFGIAARYETALVLVGPRTRNGKSTLLTVLTGLVPDGATVAIAPHDLDQEYRRAQLAGKLLNVVSELSERELLDVTAFKAIVSGELVQGRAIRQSPFKFRPVAAHVFAVNRLPPVGDTTEGFSRRLLVLEFNNRFVLPPAVLDLGQRTYAADPDLREALLEELSQIAAWAVAGALRLQEKGAYTVPASHQGVVESWRDLGDPLRTFVREHLVATPPKAEQWVQSIVLYGRYRQWCTDNGHTRPLTGVRFSIDLVGMGFVRKKFETANFFRVVFVEAGRSPADAIAGGKPPVPGTDLLLHGVPKTKEPN